MKKRINVYITSIFLAVLLVVCTACGNKAEFKKTSTNLYFGDTESSDPLRILVDIQTSNMNYSEIERAMEELLSAVKTDIGEQDVIVEFIPIPITEQAEQDLVARKTAVSRLRTEIMAGAGPDVFIMTYQRNTGAAGHDMDSGDILFKSPQKVMESGLFLPLDEYIANNTKHTEWEKFPQAVMDAGRNDEGQQIIPLAYTLPVMIYPKEVFDYTPERLMTWDDMLTDPELSPYAADLINSYGYYDYKFDERLSPGYLNPYLEFSLGEIADYETGELLFTEEELWQHVQEIIALPSEDVQPDAEDKLLGVKVRSYTQPITLLPLYSDDGGVSARIDYYAAVNRNTKWPEESFKVIDILMSAKAQQSFQIYTNMMCSYIGTTYPMYDELYKKDSTIQMHASEENYNEICELREQITSAYFDGEPSAAMSNLVEKCIIYPNQAEYLVKGVYEDLQRRVRE